jgi:uncharacterized protein YuzE
MAETIISDALVADLLALHSKQMWIDYDDETDVLYISFRKPQQANDSLMEGDYVYHYRNDQLVGVTILHASQKG